MTDKLEMPLEQFAEAVAKENARLNARILLLEGWLNGSLNVIEAFVACDTKEARKALEGKDD